MQFVENDPVGFKQTSRVDVFGNIASNLDMTFQIVDFVKQTMAGEGCDVAQVIIPYV